MNTQQTKTDVNQIFRSPMSQQNQQCLQRFYIEGDEIFTLQDVEAIEAWGITTWAMCKGVGSLEDMTLDWKSMPSVLRAMILSDAIELLGISVRYAIPFRHVGRVLTVAILPVEREPIQVQRSSTEHQQQINPSPRDFLLDPPVPYPSLGLASHEALVLHAEIVRQVLQQANSSTQIAPLHLKQIWTELARTGQATCSEVLYYTTQLRSLVSEAWRHVR